MMNEPTPKEIKETRLYAEWGLTDEEYHQIETILQREPNYTETGLFSVMWSEHCSYKNSKPVLKKFPTEGPQVLQGPGEGAGIVDIGDGLAVVFKAESHNHPSAVLMDTKDLWSIKCDIALPCATQNEIDLDDAKK
ncbi:MAG: hypothetical protein HUJ63_13840, partial [Enterococcus sp.]|nr:hypothetical protein [Enterococcus sp.]